MHYKEVEWILWLTWHKGLHRWQMTKVKLYNNTKYTYKSAVSRLRKPYTGCLQSVCNQCHTIAAVCWFTLGCVVSGDIGAWGCHGLPQSYSYSKCSRISTASWKNGQKIPSISLFYIICVVLFCFVLFVCLFVCLFCFVLFSSVQSYYYRPVHTQPKGQLQYQLTNDL